MNDHSEKAARFLALRRSGALSPKEAPPKKRKAKQKREKKPRGILEANERKGAERVLAKQDVAMVHKAATAAGHTVELVADSSRNLRVSRLMIDGALTEIRYVTKLAPKKTRPFARFEFSRARVSGDLDHIALVDVEGFPLAAYRFSSGFLHQEMFVGSERTSAELYIPLDFDRYARFRLSWPFERARPAE